MSSFLQEYDSGKVSVCIIAGEASGDAQGALLLTALSSAFTRLGYQLDAWGSGGTQLRAAGLDTVVDIQQLSAMGFAEVASAYPRISSAANTLRSLLRSRRPDITILIDYPGLNMRLMEDAFHLGSLVVYHIPPKVWAHGAARVARLRDYTYLVTCILPFEEKLLRHAGINAKFIGNPLNDEIQDLARMNPDSARAQTRERVIALVPGSRSAEIEKVFPLLVESFVTLKRKSGLSLGAVVPVAPTVSLQTLESIMDDVLQRTEAEELRAAIHFRQNEPLRNVVGAADYAWVCSGTAALEVAFLQVPMAVVYRMNWLSYAIAKRLVHLPHISLVNLCAGREIVPEFVQDDANVANLVEHAKNVLGHPEVFRVMQDNLSALKQMFPLKSAENAAQYILGLFEELPREGFRRFHYKVNRDHLTAEREWGLNR